MNEEIKYNFVLTFSIILTTIGVIGNSIVLCTLMTLKFRTESYFRYLIFSTITNTLNLFFMWVANVPNVFKINSISAVCKFYQYFSFVIYELSIWIIALSSIDRLITVLCPVRFSYLNRFGFQAVLMSIVFIVLAVINAPYIMFYGISQNENDTYCGYNGNNMKFGFYMDLLNAFICTIIPCLLMIFSSIIISFRLIKNKRKLSLNRKDYTKEKNIAKVMCSVNIFYLVCSLPFSILTVSYDAVGMNYFGTYAYHVVNTITFFNSAFLIFIFILTNKLFRKVLFTCGFLRNTRSNQGTNSSVLPL